LEGGPPIFRQDFSCPALLEDQGTPLPVPGCHRLWRAVPDASGSSSLATGLVRVRSPLLAESHPPAQRAERLWLLSFPPATEMFQFAGFASHGYRFTVRSRFRGGLPHSDIRGSPGARPSPRLFAACHVLHRLSVPRHPPDALLVLRPRPAPSTRQMAKDRCRMTDGAEPDPQVSAPGRRIRQRSLPSSRLAAGAQAPPLADARASAFFAYPCSRSSDAHDGRRPDLLHGHDSLHDVNRSDDRWQRAAGPACAAAAPSSKAAIRHWRNVVPMIPDARRKRRQVPQAPAGQAAHQRLLSSVI
jgi:hypothetical protein